MQLIKCRQLGGKIILSKEDKELLSKTKDFDELNRMLFEMLNDPHVEIVHDNGKEVRA